MYNFIFWLITFVIFANPPREKVSAEITFCSFELSSTLKQANASFNISYSFEIGRDGKPVKIVKLLDDYVGDEKVLNCLTNWRFHGLSAGAKLVALFRWQHGEGWVEVSVSGPVFSQRIKLTGDRCPYLRKDKN